MVSRAQNFLGQDTFTFPARRIFAWMFAFLIGLGAVLSVSVWRQNGWKSGLEAFSLLVPFWCFAAAVVLLMRSDIVVDDLSIARRLFGWNWQRVRWDDLARVRLRTISTRAGMRTIFFLEKITSKPKRLCFTNEVDMLGQLLGRINQVISANHVPVSDERAGNAVELQQIPLVVQTGS